MPLRNRVTPHGRIEAVAARGMMMGNRGILHDEQGRLGRALWRHKRWVACAIEFRGRDRKPLMRPGRYTELFFLDEAVALAAGHRPCKECRRAAFEAFAASWGAARPGCGAQPKADDIDSVLHEDRVGAGRRQARLNARLGDLPAGCMVECPDRPDQVWLILDEVLLRWTHTGYDEKRARDPMTVVSVLTPRSSVGALRAGYRPSIHASAS